MPEPRHPRRWAVLLTTASAFAAGVLCAQPQATAPLAFRALCDKAMDAMMQGMTARSSGDVDTDFVALMIPHHQGAIDMAVAELRYGHDEQLRRIAQEIIVDQQQEIAAMRLAAHEPLPPASPAPTTPSQESP